MYIQVNKCIWAQLGHCQQKEFVLKHLFTEESHLINEHLNIYESDKCTSLIKWIMHWMVYIHSIVKYQHQRSHIF